MRRKDEEKREEKRQIIEMDKLSRRRETEVRGGENGGERKRCRKEDKKTRPTRKRKRR